MNQKHWDRWVMQTARTWEDLAPVIKETGVAPVDHDHRRLAEYILELNELLLQLEQDFNIALVQEQRLLLGRFLTYTRAHFIREEEFLAKYQIPGLEQQQEEHDRILNMLEEILFEFQTGRISSAFKLRLQILNWVVKHINSTDYKTFDFLNICEAILAVDSWQDIKGFIRNVHVPPIDYEHKGLTEAIINVGQSIQTFNQSGEHDHSSVLKSLENVIRRTEQHFNHEIEIIRKYSIPGIEVQLDQHEGFVSYLKNQAHLLREGRLDKLDELERELLFWWIQHINIFDYQTFRKGNWISSVFSASNGPEDVAWLINPTGIGTIDRDHYHFVELLFETRFLSNSRIDHHLYLEESLKEMDLIIAYAKGHFEREEEIMIVNHKEIYERHKKEHQLILNKLEDHRSALVDDLIDLSGQLRKMLLHWWIDHTNGIDYETFGAEYDR